MELNRKNAIHLLSILGSAKIVGSIVNAAVPHSKLPSRITVTVAKIGLTIALGESAGRSVNGVLDGVAEGWNRSKKNQTVKERWSGARIPR